MLSGNLDWKWTVIKMDCPSKNDSNHGSVSSVIWMGCWSWHQFVVDLKILSLLRLVWNMTVHFRPKSLRTLPNSNFGKLVHGETTTKPSDLPVVEPPEWFIAWNDAIELIEYSRFFHEIISDWWVSELIPRFTKIFEYLKIFEAFQFLCKNNCRF